MLFSKRDSFFHRLILFSRCLSVSLSLLVVFVSATQIQFLPFHIIMQILIWLCCKFPPYHRYTDVITVKRGISLKFYLLLLIYTPTMWGCDIIGVRLCAAIPSILNFILFTLCACLSLSHSLGQMRLINNAMSNALGARKMLPLKWRWTRTRDNKNQNVQKAVNWNVRQNIDNSIRELPLI